MQLTDAVDILIKAFPLDGVMADTLGNTAYLFSGDFDYAAAEMPDGAIRLSAQLDGLMVGHNDLARRLLEANLTGVETGAGAMAPDPMGSGLYALVETVRISDLSADAFRQRIVDFMLYVEYWRSEGVASLRAQVRNDKRMAGMSTDEVVVRA